jgi:hypothetical protein
MKSRVILAQTKHIVTLLLGRAAFQHTSNSMDFVSAAIIVVKIDLQKRRNLLLVFLQKR